MEEGRDGWQADRQASRQSGKTVQVQIRQIFGQNYIHYACDEPVVKSKLRCIKLNFKDTLGFFHKQLQSWTSQTIAYIV